MTTDQAMAWTIGGASVRGAAHVRTGRPNQDAIGWSPGQGVAACIVGAVSDGHGAVAHFRSQVGAQIAVERAMARLISHIEDDPADEDDSVLAGDILRAWRRAVDAHTVANPYGAEPPKPGPRLAPYGATLLVMGAGNGVMTILQIGDGDLMLGYPDGRIERPLRSDVGLVGEETYSLCQDDAETRFRVASLWQTDGLAWPDFALLSTDGVSKSYESDAAFEDAVRRLRALARDDWPALISNLPDWLAELSAKGSGDDATLCLATRAPSQHERTPR